MARRPSRCRVHTPITMTIDFVQSEMADKAALLPGARRADRRLEYTRGGYGHDLCRLPHRAGSGKRIEPMAQIEINGAQIYYETFGQDRPGQAPVLLIHGSTSTGKEDWELVAPLLARRRRVIVPDCRGHGRSSNPNLSYSFTEMAADMAALVRALGYQRAHVIGHSNGGNVALVVLMEHPEVVQSAVPQAANAYVSPDLVEKEPAIFDPERVAREAPAWMKA